MPVNIKCPMCKETRSFMSRKEIDRGWCSKCEQSTWTEERKQETKQIFSDFIRELKNEMV